MKHFIIFLIVQVVLSHSSFATDQNTIQFVGTGCDQKAGLIKMNSLSQSETKYIIPFILKFDKSPNLKILRKVCQFSLPFKVDKNKKLIFESVSQKINLNHEAQNSLQVELGLTLIGQNSSKKIQFDVNKAEPKQLIQKQLNETGVFLNSKCGKETLLRVNLNAFAEGASKTSLNSEELVFSVKEVLCDK